ncbi:MAG: hypothetical protein ACJ76J_10340 [Thermoanaerobaculia bacterium]
MGTIICTVSGNEGTLTFESISEATSSSTWAEFDGVGFEISGGGTFTFILTVKTDFSDFRFDTSIPIDWTGGQPTWIQISGTTTPTSLTLTAESTAAITSIFTIRNATHADRPVGVVLASTGGSGGAGGTVYAYMQSQQKVLIGPLPAGAQAAGRDVTFGFRDVGGNEILLMPAEGTELLGLTFDPSQPDFITWSETGGRITILINNEDPSNPVHAEFMIQTNFGLIDPTIVTNPDENGP